MSKVKVIRMPRGLGVSKVIQDVPVSKVKVIRMPRGLGVSKVIQDVPVR